MIMMSIDTAPSDYKSYKYLDLNFPNILYDNTKDIMYKVNVVYLFNGNNIIEYQLPRNFV